MNIIHTKFKTLDQVKIKPLEKTEGRIQSIFISPSNNPEYNVRYFDRGAAMTSYFYEDELE